MECGQASPVDVGVLIVRVIRDIPTTQQLLFGGIGILLVVAPIPSSIDPKRLRAGHSRLTSKRLLLLLLPNGLVVECGRLLLLLLSLGTTQRLDIQLLAVEVHHIIGVSGQVSHGLLDDAAVALAVVEHDRRYKHEDEEQRSQQGNEPGVAHDVTHHVIVFVGGCHGAFVEADRGVQLEGGGACGSGADLVHGGDLDGVDLPGGHPRDKEECVGQHWADGHVHLGGSIGGPNGNLEKEREKEKGKIYNLPPFCFFY